MKANVIVSPPVVSKPIVKKTGRRMSPVNNTNVVTRDVPKVTGVNPSNKDVFSILEEANTVLECTYIDSDIVFVRILNGYGQRVYMLVDQRGVCIDNKMYRKDCTIEKNVIYTEKSFEKYATLCKDKDVGCAVEHEDKIFISLCGTTYLIHASDYTSTPTYYPATSMHKILTPNLFNSITSTLYSEMRTQDSSRIVDIIDRVYECSTKISTVIDDIGNNHSSIIEKLFKEMNRDIRSRDKLVNGGDKTKYLEKVAVLKTNNERVIDVNTIADIVEIETELNGTHSKLSTVLNKLSDYMRQI